MTLTHQAICAALFPIALRDLPSAMATFLNHIGRRNERKRPKQIEAFLQETGPPAGPVAPATLG